VIAEYDNGAAPASPTRENIYAGGKLLATITAGTPPVTNYYHSDHLSVRLMTDSNGNKIGEQGHYPFGESWYTQNSSTKWTFTSYERDGETGLDFAMARYYDSSAARFCSADPLGGRPNDPQSWNRYAYVRNDPINLTDPTGLSFLSWLFRGIGALLAGIGVLTGNPWLVTFGLQIAGAGLWANLSGAGVGIPSGPYPGSTPTTFPGDPGYHVSSLERQYATTAPFLDPATAPSINNSVASSSNPCAKNSPLFLSYSQKAWEHIWDKHVDPILYSNDPENWKYTFQLPDPLNQAESLLSVNAWTFQWGKPTLQGNGIKYEYTFSPEQRIPAWGLEEFFPEAQVDLGISLGRNAVNHSLTTLTNRLIVQDDCEHVVSSYPIPKGP